MRTPQPLKVYGPGYRLDRITRAEISGEPEPFDILRPPPPARFISATPPGKLELTQAGRHIPHATETPTITREIWPHLVRPDYFEQTIRPGQILRGLTIEDHDQPHHLITFPAMSVCAAAFGIIELRPLPFPSQ